MSRRAPRKRSGRSERRRGLVVTEGTVTEPQYLQLLKQAMPRSIASFTVCGEGTDPLRVVKRAVKEQAKSDHDWVVCLVDRDEHQTLEEAFELARKHGIRVLVSNPCFDVWLLWHFKDWTRHSDSKKLQTELKDLNASREKQEKHLSSSFPVKQYREAYTRARRAEANQIGPNPSSGMPVLLDLLEGIIPRSDG
ncbi:RloB domain-containing protein [Arachnia propionica]|uniref:RloB domain-containing protein n=1 Tax=Arachnia propionica TaxID=1750 RepID=A0A3P1T3H7_9ACTN|nr:RloB domain-containing protein [Arachnia propionica]